MTVPVEILGLFLDQATGSSIVLLGDREEATHVLPIFIGPAEAQSIAVGLQGIEPPRPGTHDLMVDVMELMHGHLNRVVVTSLRDGAFLAELMIETPAGMVPVDSRPSDGIALAVRFGAPVLVDQAVFDAAAIEIDRDSDQPFAQNEIEDIVLEFEGFLETATASDFAEPTKPPPELESPDDDQN